MGISGVEKSAAAALRATAGPDCPMVPDRAAEIKMRRVVAGRWFEACLARESRRDPPSA